jgi:diguanylate cyclase (GGDEF)-like protein
MPTPLQDRLRRRIEQSLQQADGRSDLVDTLLENVDALYREAEIESALSARLGLGGDEPAAGNGRAASEAWLDTLPDIVFVVDDNGIVLDCRGGDPEDLTLPRQSLIGRCLTRCPFDGLGPRLAAAMADARNGKRPNIVEYTLPRGEGRATFEARISRSGSGGFVVVVRNTSDREPCEAAAGTRNGDTTSVLMATFDSTADGILVVDSKGGYVASNSVFHELWRIPRHMLGRGQEAAVAEFAKLQVKNAAALAEEFLAIQHSARDRTNHVIQFKDGRFVECVSMPQRIEGRQVGRVWSFRDITDRVQVEERFRHGAYHDSLTRLPNRAMFQDRLAQEVARARRTRRSLALLLLDLDRFKTINDTLGHAAGDRLLVEVATRLTSRKREHDMLARLGGDEFVLVIADLRHKEDAALVAEQFLDVLKTPIAIDEHDLHVSASIGIALFPDDGEESTTLMKRADMALYRAKELGRDNYQMFEPQLNQRAMERLVLEKDLRRAIHDREFVLHYQPQFDLKTGAMRGVEALVRWKQGEDVLSPAKFIPIAEECGLIVPLGRWVLEEAVRQCAEFNQKSPEPLRICVNVSALQIQRPNFALEVSKILEEARLQPGQLVIELTESALMKNPGQGSYAMEQLRRMGIGIAMDDFGTGHSSLNYVSVLPISLIKIDRSFVENCAKRKTDASILTAIVAMGHALDLKVLAEGVETEEQARVLREQGCDEVQGFLYSRPVSASQLLEKLKVP